jgi:hypothetical protein
VAGTSFNITGLTLQTPIAPDNSITFNVILAPGISGNTNGSVSLLSNAPNSPLTISLSGTGIAATYVLGANPASLNFGSVTMNSNSSSTVTLANNGNSDITLFGLNVSGAGFSASGISPNLILSPSQSIALNVTFSPTTAGTVSGTITVDSNASSPSTISLSGTGTRSSPSVYLSWSPSSSTGVIGYNVYRGSVAGGPYTTIISSPVAGTTFTDTAVQAGQTYYYVVTSLGAESVESAYSNPAAVTLP